MSRPRGGRHFRGCPHCKEEVEFTQRIGANECVRALPLSVSTRGIGFGIQMLAYDTKFSKFIHQPDIHGLYRAFLGLFEVKMQEMIYGDFIEHISAIRKRKLDRDFVWAAKSVIKVPEPINRIISSAGEVSRYGNRYLAYIPKENVTSDNQFIPEPEFVTLSNLRKVVEHLADAKTPGVFRSNFRSKNPIPGTLWSNENVLLNPNDIIPVSYSSYNFSDDLFPIVIYTNQIETYYPKLRGGLYEIEKIKGRQSLFVSNDSGNLRQPELDSIKSDISITKLLQKIPTGKTSIFRSNYSMESSEWVDGAACLLGEISSFPSHIHPLSTLRTEQACSRKKDLSYSSAIRLRFS